VGAASHSPLLVILEDLHASDPSSLALLSFFARELRGASICTVVTHALSRRPRAHSVPLVSVSSLARVA
jgi:predicted ATPase